MTLDEAPDLLSRSAASQQLPAADTPATESRSGHRELQFSRRVASLRLHYSLGDGAIRLGITHHGPENEPAGLWLDLCKARSAMDTGWTDEPGVSSGDAIEFGLEPMYPSGSGQESA